MYMLEEHAFCCGSICWATWCCSNLYFLADLLSSYCVHLKAEYWSLQLLLNCLFIPSFQQFCFMYFKAK